MERRPSFKKAWGYLLLSFMYFLSYLPSNLTVGFAWGWKLPWWVATLLTVHWFFMLSLFALGVGNCILLVHLLWQRCWRGHESSKEVMIEWSGKFVDFDSRNRYMPIWVLASLLVTAFSALWTRISSTFSKTFSRGRARPARNPRSAYRLANVRSMPPQPGPVLG